MALDKSQKNFIENKVKKLGSLIAVKKFYHKKCLVTDYAYELAEQIYEEVRNEKYSS